MTERSEAISDRSAEQSAPETVTLYECDGDFIANGRWLQIEPSEDGRLKATGRTARYIREDRHREAVELLREFQKWLDFMNYADTDSLMLEKRINALLSRESDGAKEKP